MDPHVGDIEGNCERIRASVIEARERGCQIAVLPELAVTGYPPEDLLLNRSFLRECARALECLGRGLEGIVALVGCPEDSAGRVFNSVAVIADGEVRSYARKMRLPNYGVFDEQRYFTPAEQGSVLTVDGVRVGLTICEDIWVPGDPCAAARAAGAQLLINCSASPFHAGKGRERMEMLAGRACEHGLPVAYCAMVGGQDELVFDGQSLVLDADGELRGRGPQFEEALIISDIEVPSQTASDLNRVVQLGEFRTLNDGERDVAAPTVAPSLADSSEVEQALILGLRAYVLKNGFNGVVLGVSGGIDSAVAATLAVDAIGADRVHGVVMPSPWSSDETQSDARTLCANLGIELIELPIESAMTAFAQTLENAPTGPGESLADENIQARIRGNLLMALSNRLGWLVVTTGNKSELAVGYSTLYGDAAGGFGVLKDVPKHLVYSLAELRNRRADAPIPRSIIDRAPSAELRPGQKDSDSLPPYAILDEILRMYVEERADAAEIAAAGHDEETVGRVLSLVDRAEYKRRQYPPGVKITPLAFGRDRRMPMTNRFRP